VELGEKHLLRRNNHHLGEAEERKKKKREFKELKERRKIARSTLGTREHIKTCRKTAKLTEKKEGGKRQRENYWGNPAANGSGAPRSPVLLQAVTAETPPGGKGRKKSTKENV